MAAVTRKGDLNTGHDLCVPVPLIEGSPNVFVNGQPCGRVGDQYEAHGCVGHASHNDQIAAGSATVFVNGKPIGRIGDAVVLAGSVAQGSGNVFAGG